MSESQNLPVPAPEYQFAWTQATAVASLAGIVAVILTICTLIIDRIQRGKLEDPLHFATRRHDMGYFWADEMGWWAAFWKQTTKTPKLTTVRGLIEAGDKNLWSSAAFDQLEPYHGEVSWTPIYSAIYSQIAKDRGSKLELDEDIDVHAKKYLIRALEDTDPAKDKGQYRRKLIGAGRLVCCIRPLDVAQEDPKNPVEPERRLTQKSPSWAKRRVGPTESTYEVTYPEKSLRNSEYIWMRSGKPSIEISREELLALSLTLGITLQINDYTQNVRGLGPFGTGLNVVQDNGEWKLEVVHGARLTRHKASRGSGYTSLFAKHIAFGSLPFADTTDWIRSVYVNDGILKAIKRGDSIVDGSSFGGRPLQILRRLPGSKQIDAYYHWSDAANLKLEPHSEHQPGQFYRSDKKTRIAIRRQKRTTAKPSELAVFQQDTPLPTLENGPESFPSVETPMKTSAQFVPPTLHDASQEKDASNSTTHSRQYEEIYANWTRAVTGIAFGGLVPQSSDNLAQAVEFTVDEFHDRSNHRKEVENLINKVEDLINQIQAWDCRHVIYRARDKRELEDLEKPFGDYVAERAPSEENVDNIYYAIPLRYHDTQEAAASFARYMNLLERMVALFEANDVLETPKNGTPKEASSSATQLSPSYNFSKWTTYILCGWHSSSNQSPGKPKQEVKALDLSEKREMVFEESCRQLQKVYVAAANRYRQSLPNNGVRDERSQSTSSNYHRNTLSEKVKSISEKVKKARNEFSKAESESKQCGDSLLDITLDDCVLIVRCILAIWANQVPKMHNADMSETDPELDRIEGREQQHGKVEPRIPRTKDPANLMDLPQVMAFA